MTRPLIDTSTSLPEIPLALFKGMTDLERALYFIGLRDRNEQAIAARGALRSGGVCWSGMSGGSAYTPKTYDQMLEEAQEVVGRQVSASLKIAAE